MLEFHIYLDYMNSARKYSQSKNMKNNTQNVKNIHQDKNLCDSLPPPHPSNFIKKTNYEENGKNMDLNTHNEVNKNDFLTLGRESKNNENKSGSSFYPRMSRHSEKIVEQYKLQNEKALNK